MKYLVVLIAFCFVFSACPPAPPVCPPFNQSYSWGPNSDNGDKLILQQHIKNYLDNALPASNCPAPSAGTAPQVWEKKCNNFPETTTTNCLFKEYLISNTPGPSTNYSPTVISGCALKQELDAYISQIMTGFYCNCQETYGSIHPDFDVQLVTYFALPPAQMKRRIYINTTYRCCGPCK